VSKNVHRQCNLCEAHCGITVEVSGAAVLRITGDPEDHHSRGYICPKVTALRDLYEDPDRLRRPVRRAGDRWEELSWEDAIDFAARGLSGVRARHGADAIANYLGNPGAHSWSVLSFLGLRAVLGTRNNYSATSADQLPQHVVSAEMFGNVGAFPIPDVDRTQYMLVIGANPAVSNGSLMSAPGIRDRLRKIERVVVVDPRRSETARLAAEHVWVKPGGDPYLLLGMLHTIFASGLEDLGSIGELCDGLEEVRALASEWPVARCAGPAGVDGDVIARLAREFAASPRAVAYGRAGVCQTETGSLTHWLINVLNAVTGNLDSVGGAMFTRPAVDPAILVKAASRLRIGLYRTRTARTTGLPAVIGELPVAGLSDEMLTPGPGQVRGLVTYAGNPVLSTPGGRKLEEAIAGLEFYVAVDQYVTETTRHADVILPPVSQLERDDLDVVLTTVAVRNHIKFSPAAVPKQPGGLEDWEILTRLAARLGAGVTGRVVAGAIGLGSRLGLSSPAQTIDVALALGPYGVLRRGRRRGLTVARIKKAPHGIDLGALTPQLPGLLITPGKRVRLAPALFLDEGARLQDDRSLADGFDLTLIGRRSLHSNNSWLHNSARMMKGPDRCTARLHPDDAAARGLSAGDRVRVISAAGEISLPLEVTDEIRAGVISIPHGYGHGRPGVGWTLAASKPGASVNDITDPRVVDRISGNAAFNSVPVRVEAVAAPDLSGAGAPEPATV
jgi:anaerobic selenocysteine-containing dehydrogenase